MTMWKVSNALCLSEDYEGKMNTEEMMKEGVGSIIDTRLQLPSDFLKRERKDLLAASIQYSHVPMDVNSIWPMNMIDRTCGWILGDISYGLKACIHQNVEQGNAEFLASLAMLKMGFTPEHSVHMVEESKKPMKLSEEQKHMLNSYAEISLQRMFNKEMDTSQFYMLLQDKMNQLTKPQTSEARLYDFLSVRTMGGPESSNGKKSCGCGVK